MFKLIFLFYRLKILNFKGIFNLLSSIFVYKINIMALLYLAKKVYGNKIAIIDENEKITYNELFYESEKIRKILYKKYGLRNKQKVAFLCKNHIVLIKSLFAVSALGVDIYLLNIEMGTEKFKEIANAINFSLIIYDKECEKTLIESGYCNNKILSYDSEVDSIHNFREFESMEDIKLEAYSSGKIIILTSGSTGKFKPVVHKPSLFNFLNPLLALINKLNLTLYNSVYIMTPIYHGYGIAILFLFITLGKRIVITQQFASKNACNIIKNNNVDIIVAVPLMIYKLIECDIRSLGSLKCIITGGAKLNAKLVENVFCRLGPILNNIYGTSESGLISIATSSDLKYSYTTVGKKIFGTKIRIMDSNKNVIKDGEIGQFFIKTKWSMKMDKCNWLAVGDLGYKDAKGYYFLSGRVDDMIVSAGENVYPVELERIIIGHPDVVDVYVVGVDDELFGQRLIAYIQILKESVISKEDMINWIKPKVPRYYMPRDIEFIDCLPYNNLGKIEKYKKS